MEFTEVNLAGARVICKLDSASMRGRNMLGMFRSREFIKDRRHARAVFVDISDDSFNIIDDNIGDF